MTKFGEFGDFCRDSNLVVCNLFRTGVARTCTLEGFKAVNGHHIGNLGAS